MSVFLGNNLFTCIISTTIQKLFRKLIKIDHASKELPEHCCVSSNLAHFTTTDKKLPKLFFFSAEKQLNQSFRFWTLLILKLLLRWKSQNGICLAILLMQKTRRKNQLCRMQCSENLFLSKLRKSQLHFAFRAMNSQYPGTFMKAVKEMSFRHTENWIFI